MGAAKSNETSERPMNDPCLLRCLTPSLIINYYDLYTLNTIVYYYSPSNTYCSYHNCV